MSRWEEWQRARRMRDGQESEKRRENRLPERRRWADRGGDSLRGLNRRAYARGPGQSRARFVTNRGRSSLAGDTADDMAGVIETVFVKSMLVKTDETDLKMGLFMDDFSIVQVFFATGRCDEERARRSMRAREARERVGRVDVAGRENDSRAVPVRVRARGHDQVQGPP